MTRQMIIDSYLEAAVELSTRMKHTLRDAANFIGFDSGHRNLITDSFPCSIGGGTSNEAVCDGEISGAAPEASSSDDDDGGDPDPDPARRRRKSSRFKSGKHRNATATDGDLLASRNHTSLKPVSSTGAPIFPPLEEVNRPIVSTEQAAFYLLRRPQTLRGWACNEDGPIRPIRVGNRLGWPVAQIRAVLGV